MLFRSADVRLEQRNAGQGRSSKPVRRRRLAMVSVADASYVEVSYVIIFSYANTQRYSQVLTQTISSSEGWGFGAVLCTFPSAVTL